jgi:hypothetical protein
VAAFRLGHLKPSWDEGDPTATTLAIANDYFAPLLGDVGILGASGRDIDVSGRAAHETVIVTNPASDGSMVVIDLIVVPAGSTTYYLELARTFAANTDIPDGVFLPEMADVARTLVLP